MKIFLALTVVAILSAFLSILNGCGGSSKAERIGLVDAHLRPCPDSPNCVSSEAENVKQRVEPFRLKIPPAEAWTTAKAALTALPRTKVISSDANYLHAECRSAVFGFVDDLELHLRPTEKQIAVRSAARLGYSDLGVNRKRVEKLRKRLLKQGVIGLKSEARRH